MTAYINNMFPPFDLFSHAAGMSIKLFNENNTLFVAVKNNLYTIRDNKPFKIDICIDDIIFKNIFYKENTWIINIYKKGCDREGYLLSGKDLDNLVIYAFPEKYKGYESTIFIVDNMLYAFLADGRHSCYLLKSENGKMWNESKLDTYFDTAISLHSSSAASARSTKISRRDQQINGVKNKQHQGTKPAVP